MNAAMSALVTRYEEALREKRLPPLLAVAFFNLDFLCIHPFRDGDGRVSRLLLLIGAYGSGFEVGRYISLERLIEEEKEGYYRALELSSAGWHSGGHDPWPYVTYLFGILKRAYGEMETRAAMYREAKGERSTDIRAVIARYGREFSVDEVKDACPAAGVELIRKVLKKLRAEGRMRCVKRGRDARWATVVGELGKDN
ncbi:MAG: Fic family protein [Spirochaetota bacterium]